MRTSFTRLSLLAALLSTAALAQAPNKVGYQGLLLKSDGTPETGMASIRFSVFDAASGGTELWNELQSNVVLTQGFYSTVLGEVTAFPANLLDGTERFLEISVGGSALTPRMRVVSVPYAVRSTSAQNVTGGTVNASSISINGTTVIDGTGALSGNATYTGVNGISVTGRNIGLRSSCQAGEILRWDVTSTSWVCSPFAAASGDGGVVSYNADPDGGLVLIGANFTTFSLLRSCAASQVLKWSGNAWVCANDLDNDTTYSVAAGQGLASSGVGNTLFGLQLCPLGQILKSGAGTWSCQADTDTQYTATANRGLLLTGTGFAIDACPSGQVMKSTGGGAWACAPDGDTLFDVIAAAGIRRQGNNFGLDQCPSGQVLKSGGSGIWGCQPDNDSLGTVTQITANNGLTGGVINSVGTIGLAPTVPNWTFATPAFCAPGSVLRVIAQDGTPTCQAIAAGGTVTSIVAGNGIVTGPDAGITTSGAIAVAATVQNWTAGQPNCPAGQAIASIAANGTPNCVTISLDGGGGGGGSVTSVGSGAGLTGGPITGSGSLSIAAAGVTNAMIANPSVTITAGSGLSGGGTVALGGSTSLSLATPVGIASGGTGTTQSPTAAGQFLRSSAPGAWSVATIGAGDLPNLNGTYVDLGSNQTITGVKTFSFNIVGNLSGNATTVTNGVYTNSTYADPAFITSLAGSKVSGNITGNSAGFSGNLGGDVTGPQGTTQVVGLRGVAIGALPPASNDAMMFNGTIWAPTAINLGNATVGGVTPIGKGGTGTSTSPAAAGQFLRSTGANAWGVAGLSVSDIPGLSASYVDLVNNQSIAGTKTFINTIAGNISGNAGGTSSGFTGALAGDVIGTQGATVVDRLGGTPLDNAAPTTNQVLRYNGTRWAPGSVGATAPIGLTGLNVSLTTCPADQIYKMNPGGTAWICAVDNAGSGGGTYGVQPNQGLQINGANNFGLITCANNQVLRYDTGSGTWGCSAVTNAMLNNSSLTVGTAGGSGLSGGGLVTLGGSLALTVDTSVQRRTAGAPLTCPGGFLRTVAQDGTSTCVSYAGNGAADSVARSDHTHAFAEVDGIIGNEITNVTGTGLSRTGTGTAIDPYRVALTNCGINQILKMDVAGSAWTCQNDSVGTVTSVTAGTGLQATTNPIVGSGTLSIAPTVQNWTSGQPSCAAGQVLRGISAIGVPTCVSPAPVDTYFTFSVLRGANQFSAWISCVSTSCNIPVFNSPYGYCTGGSCGTITVTRTAVGQYSLAYDNVSLDNGVPFVTTYSAPAGTVCQSTGWSGTTWGVACYNVLP